jgi:hypothetical protein
VIFVRHFVSRKGTAIGSNSVNKFERAVGYRRVAPAPEDVKLSVGGTRRHRIDRGEVGGCGAPDSKGDLVVAHDLMDILL